MLADPYALFNQARAAVTRQALPPYIAFTEQNLGSSKFTTNREQVRVLVRTSDGHACVKSLINRDGTIATQGPRVVEDGDYVALTDIYRVGDFPLADFGMRYGVPARPGIFDAPGTPEPGPSEPFIKVIGEVSSRNRFYEITNRGEETIDGRDVIHLSLRPVRDPGHHVLRELWLDSKSLLPQRYVAERFVGDTIPFRYLVTVQTQVVSGHLVNVASDGHYNVNRALIIHITGEGKWTISNVKFPASEPSWLFDARTFTAHAGDPLPDF